MSIDEAIETWATARNEVVGDDNPRYGEADRDGTWDWAGRTSQRKHSLPSSTAA